jgi:hypothetical protein
MHEAHKAGYTSTTSHFIINYCINVKKHNLIVLYAIELEPFINNGFHMLKLNLQNSVCTK